MERWIAYIDDSEMNLEALGHFLSSDFQVDCYLMSASFLKSYPQKKYEAILVDLHMPKMNGFETFEAIIGHPAYNGCPILIVSSDDSIESRVKSFELGAVDYINRSISIEQMIAQINAKIQFFKKQRPIVEFENLKIDQTQVKVFIGGVETPMTFIEIKILSHILRSYPDNLSKEKLVHCVWGDTVVLDNTLYTHIFNLNSKLIDWGYEIRIIKGQGVVGLIEKRA